jgi:hypothetical protein
MGSSTQTATLALPQFADNDKPTWRGDINGAFSAIDAAWQNMLTRLTNDEATFLHPDEPFFIALRHGVIGDNVADDTAAINALITLADGRPIVFPKTANGYKVAGVINANVAGTDIRLERGAALNFTTAAQNGIHVTATDFSFDGGILNSPATFDGANVAWTYAVINVDEGANRATIKNVTLNNVPKVGIGVRSADATIDKCRVYGNYPLASFTGTQTGHFGITVDPPADADGGGAVITGCHVQTCVQGVFIGNYGAGVGYGYVVTSNTFYSCWNHGVYATNGVGNNISINDFFECQTAVVVAGNSPVVNGNTMYVTESGGDVDVAGISARNVIDAVITNNTIVGDSTSANVAIDVTNVAPGVDLRRNIIMGNVIDLTGPGGQPAIRLGSGTTQTCQSNRVENNIIRGGGTVSSGIISLLMAAGYFGVGNSVSDNTITVTVPTSGVNASAQYGLKLDGNTMKCEWSATSATTLVLFKITGNSVGCTMRHNISIVQAGFGGNITAQVLRVDTGSSNCVLGPVKQYHEAGTYVAVTTFIDNGTNDVTVQDIGSYAAATTLGAVQGKVALKDPNGTIVGYLPVYATIT